MNRIERATVVALASAVLGPPAFAQFKTSAPTISGITANTPQQRSPASTTMASSPAVTTSNANKTAAALVKGVNGFTVDEVRRRIEAGGFNQVSALQKDGDGIWRGRAMRDGTSVSADCNHQGNVGAS